MTSPNDDQSDLPSLGDIDAARASQQARTATLEDLVELKRQSRQIILELVTQAASAASGIVPIPESIVGTISDKVVDHAVGFLAGLADAG